MTIAPELERVEQVIEEVEELEILESAVGENDDARETVHRMRDRRLAEVDNRVRLSVAAALLNLSVPTVRAWAKHDVLEGAGDVPVRHVTLESVLRLRPIVRELKVLGKNRHLLAAVLARVDDEHTLADPRLLESIKQMRRGELVDLSRPQ